MQIVLLVVRKGGVSYHMGDTRSRVLGPAFSDGRKPTNSLNARCGALVKQKQKHLNMKGIRYRGSICRFMLR